MTQRVMDGKDLAFSTKDITTDAKALEEVKNLGYLQAPVVVVEGELIENGIDHWSGFRPDKLSVIATIAQQTAA